MQQSPGVASSILIYYRIMLVHSEKSLTRRTAIAMAAASALSATRILGANDRVRLGLIGSGGRGREDWGNFLKQSDVEPVAVCDVYDPFREKGIAMSEGRAKPFSDFRRLLDQRDMD